MGRRGDKATRRRGEGEKERQGEARIKSKNLLVALSICLLIALSPLRLVAQSLCGRAAKFSISVFRLKSPFLRGVNHQNKLSEDLVITVIKFIGPLLLQIATTIREFDPNPCLFRFTFRIAQLADKIVRDIAVCAKLQRYWRKQSEMSDASGQP